MKTEEQIKNKIVELHNISTTMPDGRTDVLLEAKRAFTITALLYALDVFKELNLQEVAE